MTRKSFATHTPRLIRKGEKPDTFTGLALASCLKAAPEGVGMIELDRQELENLKRVSNEVGLDADGFEVLSAEVATIRFQETVSEWKSAPARRGQLSRISELSSELNEVLQSLDYVDKSAINEEMGKAAIEVHLTEKNPMREVFLRADTSHQAASHRSSLFCERVVLIGDLLLTLERIACDTQRNVIGQETGRKPRNQELSHYIVGIARCAHGYGLKVGRGGRFHQLCEAVFLAAGIKTDPDAAIRKFVTEYLPLYLKIWNTDAQKAAKTE